MTARTLARRKSLFERAQRFATQWLGTRVNLGGFWSTEQIRGAIIDAWLEGHRVGRVSKTVDHSDDTITIAGS